MSKQINKYRVANFEAMSKMLRAIGQNETGYKQALEKAKKLPGRQRHEAEQNAYYNAMETYQKIIDRYSGKLSPNDTVETIEDILANIARDAMIAAILEALKPPETPDVIREEETIINNFRMLDE